jgi:hypothetical protein
MIVPPNDFGSIIVLYKTHKNNLPRGMYNIETDPIQIIINPKTRVQLFDMPQFSGNNIILDNLSQTENYVINTQKFLESNILNKIRSINVMSNICNDSKCGMVIEGFGENDLRNSCHYICSLLNLQNIIMCLIFIILIYYLVTSYFSN